MQTIHSLWENLDRGRAVQTQNRAERSCFCEEYHRIIQDTERVVHKAFEAEPQNIDIILLAQFSDSNLLKYRLAFSPSALQSYQTT